MRLVYISSNAFPVRTFDAIFEECDRRGITHLELGSGVAYDPDARQKIIARSKKTNILLHNYIPAPEIPFVLNLAARDADTLGKSTNLVKTALEISHDIGASFYAVHSGFAYDAQPQFLGKKQTHLAHYPLSEAHNVFLASMIDLAQYARSLGVILLIENNVLPAFNLIDGANKSYLVVGPDDSLEVLNTLASLGVGLLLDTGHLAVSAQALQFSPVEFIETMRYYIKAFQLSDNDGTIDSHSPITPDSWVLPQLKTFSEDTPVTFEVNGHLDEVIKSVSWL